MKACLVSLLVLTGLVSVSGCASFTASENGHRFRGVTSNPARVMQAAGEAEVNSAYAYATRRQADDVSLAVERRDILPIPSYGYGGYGGFNSFDSEFYGLGGVAQPGYVVPGYHQGQQPVQAVDPEARRVAGENRQALQGIERVMRREAVDGGE